MQRVVIEEFYRELEATDEDYVRKRFLTGGYAGWKSFTTGKAPYLGGIPHDTYWHDFDGRPHELYRSEPIAGLM